MQHMGLKLETIKHPVLVITQTKAPGRRFIENHSQRLFGDGRRCRRRHWRGGGGRPPWLCTPLGCGWFTVLYQEHHRFGQFLAKKMQSLRLLESQWFLEICCCKDALCLFKPTAIAKELQDAPIFHSPPDYLSLGSKSCWVSLTSIFNLVLGERCNKAYLPSCFLHFSVYHGSLFCSAGVLVHQVKVTPSIWIVLHGGII